MPGLGQAMGILCVYLVLAAVYTHPVLVQSHTGIANDPYDPILNTSILWWNATTVPFSPEWWNPPYFYPARGVSAFTENLVGISLFASPVYWLTGNPLAAYNVSFFLTWPLSAFAVYLLGFLLTRRHDAAFLAGLAYAFTPYRTAELGHIQMLASYWLPMCLLALHGFLEERRGRWLLLFAAAWILQSLSNGYFIFFGAVLIGMWLIYFCTTADSWRAAPAIVLTWVLANVPLAPIMMKYQAVHEHYGLHRSISEAVAFSAPASAWVEVSQVVWFWHLLLPESQDNLFPGITAVTLVLIGVARAPWRRASVPQGTSTPRRILIVILGAATAVSVAAVLATLVLGPWRVSLAGVTIRVSELDRAVTVATGCGLALLVLTRRIREALTRRSAFLFYTVAAAVMAVLCVGPELRAGGVEVLSPMPYRWLMYLPGFDQVRVPTRFWMLGTLCLSIAAALSFARHSPERKPLRTAIFAVVVVGLLIDGWTRGISMVAAPQQWPRVERRDQKGAILELPLGPEWDAAATFRGLRHRRGVVNGVSGYDPPAYAPLQDGLNRFEPSVLMALSSFGPLDIVVNGDADPDGVWARFVASAAGEPVATDGIRRVYRIPQTPALSVSLGTALPIVAVSASSREDAELVHDGRLDTEWHDNPQQMPGHWLTLDLGDVHKVAGVTLSLGGWARDFPRRLAIDVSTDGSSWTVGWVGPTAAIAMLAAIDQPRECPMRLGFPPRDARFVRLRTLASDKNLWRVAEIQVHSP
jgi:hypothetical protein